MGAGPASSSGSKDTQVSGYEREINKQKEKAAKDKAAADNRERGRVGSQVSTDKSRSSSTASAFSRGGGGGVPNSSGGPNGNKPINQVTKTAPTTAEVSQSEAANADADTEANRLLKIKKKGRSQSIITGSKGVTKTSTDYSLGKKSLLGRI
jgi:hypothetical protein